MTPLEGFGELAGLSTGDPVAGGALEMAEGDIDADTELCAAGPGVDTQALAIKARKHMICAFFIESATGLTARPWFGYGATSLRRMLRIRDSEAFCPPV